MRQEANLHNKAQVATLREKINRKVIFFFKSIRRFILDLSYYVLDSFVLFFLKTGNKIQSDKKNLCFIRLDAIGDFVLWTSTLSEYEKKYPKTEWNWILIGSNEWAQLIDLLDIFDEFIGLDRKSFSRSLFYRYKKIALLLKYKIDVLIHPTHSRTFIFSESVVRTISAKIKYGSVGDLSNMQSLQSYISKKWYTNVLYCKIGMRMELDRHLEFINNLGIYRTEIRPPKFCIDSNDIVEILKKFHLEDRSSYFVIFPGASWSGKRWPLQRFINVSLKIHEQYGWHCLVLGGGFEKDIIDKVVATQSEFLTSLVGKTDLKSFLNIISNAKLVISNDTAAAHFAAATNTPAITIVGGGHFGRFFPYKINNKFVKDSPLTVHSGRSCFNCNWECQFSYKKDESVPCISDISEEMVMSQVRQLQKKISEKVS